MKTIIILASKAYHLSPLIDIREIPIKTREKAKFVLVVNNQLYDEAKNEFGDYYEAIFPTKMLPATNEFELYYDLKSLEGIFNYINKKYKNLEFIIQDEFNIGRIEPVLENLKMSPWMCKTANVCTNKVLMKDLMKDQDIRVPNFRELNDSDVYALLEKEFSVPFIVKPLSSAASIGVEKINNEQEYCNFLLNKSSISDHYEVEEFLDGDLYHIDSVKVGDDITEVISQYTFPQAESKQGKVVGSIPVLGNDPLYEVISDFNKSVLDALNNNGCFHLEVFIKNNQPVFLEIAWRQAGPPVNNNFTNIFGVSQSIFYICSIIENKAINFPISGFTMEYWVPKSNGIYNGISKPKLSGYLREITHISEVGKVDSNCIGSTDMACKFKLEYKGLQKDYIKIKNDFDIVKSEVFLV